MYIKQHLPLGATRTPQFKIPKAKFCFSLSFPILKVSSKNSVSGRNTNNILLIQPETLLDYVRMLKPISSSLAILNDSPNLQILSSYYLSLQHLLFSTAISILIYFIPEIIQKPILESFCPSCSSILQPQCFFLIANLITYPTHASSTLWPQAYRETFISFLWPEREKEKEREQSLVSFLRHAVCLIHLYNPQWCLGKFIELNKPN